MEARLKGFWMIAECPYCNRPVVDSRWVNEQGSVRDLFGKSVCRCRVCGKSFDLHLSVEGDSQGVPPVLAAPELEEKEQ